MARSQLSRFFCSSAIHTKLWKETGLFPVHPFTRLTIPLRQRASTFVPSVTNLSPTVGTSLGLVFLLHLILRSGQQLHVIVISVTVGVIRAIVRVRAGRAMPRRQNAALKCLV
jgi:hypothetical protein